MSIDERLEKYLGMELNEGETEYMKLMARMLKKYKVDAPYQLDATMKKKFLDEVEREWTKNHK